MALLECQSRCMCGLNIVVASAKLSLGGPSFPFLEILFRDTFSSAQTQPCFWGVQSVAALIASWWSHQDFELLPRQAGLGCHILPWVVPFNSRTP